MESVVVDSLLSNNNVIDADEESTGCFRIVKNFTDRASRPGLRLLLLLQFDVVCVVVKHVTIDTNAAMINSILVMMTEWSKPISNYCSILYLKAWRSVDMYNDDRWFNEMVIHWHRVWVLRIDDGRHKSQYCEWIVYQYDESATKNQVKKTIEHEPGSVKRPRRRMEIIKTYNYGLLNLKIYLYNLCSVRKWQRSHVLLFGAHESHTSFVSSCLDTLLTFNGVGEFRIRFRHGVTLD